MGWAHYWSLLGLGTILAGVLLGAATVLPPGTRLIPLGAVVVGSVVLLASTGRLSGPAQWQLIGGVGLALMGAGLLTRVRVERGSSADPVQTVRAVLLPRRLSFSAAVPPPHQRVFAYGAPVRVDLSGAEDGAEDVLELSVTAVLSRVELTFPPHWLVLPGRLFVGPGSHVEGRFDRNQPVMYLGSSERVEIRDLVAENDDGAPPPYPVVLNVSSFGAHVQLRRAG